jgi:phosphate starvation-inducible PhoH-like protein
MKKSKDKKPTAVKTVNRGTGRFHIEFKNPAQKMAWAGFQQHDILFLCGPAGVGKSYMAMAFAINEVLQHNKKRIIITRPIVESGESLGYLPGDFQEKVNPYMMPLYDCIKKLVGENNPQRDMINASLEVAPLAYMRGRTFDDAICIFDEAQNASLMQLRLFMTRFGENSKLVITGDPTQSDLGGPVALVHAMERLEKVPGIGTVKFKSDSIVRHPLVAKVIECLGE